MALQQSNIHITKPDICLTDRAYLSFGYFSSYECFQVLKRLQQWGEESPTDGPSGDAMVDWLRTKYAGEMLKGGGQGKTGNTQSLNRSEAAH